MKRVGEAIGRNIPTLGDGGDGLRGGFVERGETFEEGDEDHLIGERLGELRVEGGGLVLVADEERAGADALIDGRLAFGAGGEGEEESGKEKTKEAHG